MRALSLMVLVSSLSGCITWHAQSAPPRDVISLQPPQILVTQDTGSSTRLERATIRGDSLIGWEPTTKRYVGMPLSHVKTIGVPKHDPVKTTALTLGLVVGGAYMALFVSFLASSPGVIVE